jgi:hypothetical protein
MKRQMDADENARKKIWDRTADLSGNLIFPRGRQLLQDIAQSYHSPGREGDSG